MPIGEAPGSSQEHKVKTIEEACSFLKIEKPIEAKGSDSAMKDPEFTDEQMKAFDQARRKIVEELGYTVKSSEGKSMILEKDGYTVEVKHFMVGGPFGVNGGRISEIQISKGKIYAVWDRDWGSKKPKDAGVHKIIKELVQYIN